MNTVDLNDIKKQLLMREAVKIAKVASQIISIDEPSIDTILSDLKDSLHERYVGDEDELTAIIFNGKKLNIIHEADGILSVDTNTYSTADRETFVKQIYDKLNSFIQSASS